MAIPNITIIELASSKYPIKCPYSMIPKGITIHETDNTASARNEVSYMQRNDNEVSFHFACDEKDIIQGLPLDRNSWNAGDGAKGVGNRETLSIEICKNMEDDKTDYYRGRTNAERLAGYLMFLNGWGIHDLYMHKDWNGKNCPRNIIAEGYWETFKKNAVKYRDEYKNEGSTKPSTDPKLQWKVGDLLEYSYLYANETSDKKIPLPYVNKLGRGYGYITELNPKDVNPYVVSKTQGGSPIGAVKPVNIYRVNNSDILVVPSTPSKPNGIPTGAVAESGVFTCTDDEGIIMRNFPSVESKRVYDLNKGESINYDYYYIHEGYVWLRSSDSGNWVPWRVYCGEKWGYIV